MFAARDSDKAVMSDDDAFTNSPEANAESLPNARGSTIENPMDGRAVLAEVLAATAAAIAEAKAKRARQNERRREQGKEPKVEVNEQLTFSTRFAKHMGIAFVRALSRDFPEIKSGEVPSQAVSGSKRVDVRYSTTEMGLGWAVSFKSVHVGENGPDAGFIHNMKRNDEELRVEATQHHIRQPYAVLTSVLFLPFESCSDIPSSTPPPTSSFANWVAYLWPLKGRTEPEDPPDRFELVFVALYARDGSELGFYEVGGRITCPRRGRPSSLMTFEQFLLRVKDVYKKRNGMDFYYDGEGPSS